MRLYVNKLKFFDIHKNTLLFGVKNSDNTITSLLLQTTTTIGYVGLFFNYHENIYSLFFAKNKGDLLANHFEPHKQTLFVVNALKNINNLFKKIIRVLFATNYKQHPYIYSVIKLL